MEGLISIIFVGIMGYFIGSSVADSKANNRAAKLKADELRYKSFLEHAHKLFIQSGDDDLFAYFEYMAEGKKGDILKKYEQEEARSVRITSEIETNFVTQCVNEYLQGLSDTGYRDMCIGEADRAKIQTLKVDQDIIIEGERGLRIFYDDFRKHSSHLFDRAGFPEEYEKFLLSEEASHSNAINNWRRWRLVNHKDRSNNTALITARYLVAKYLAEQVYKDEQKMIARWKS